MIILLQALTWGAFGGIGNANDRAVRDDDCQVNGSKRASFFTVVWIQAVGTVAY